MAKAIVDRSVVTLAMAAMLFGLFSVAAVISRLSVTSPTQALGLLLMLPAGERELVRVVPDRERVVPDGERADRDLKRGAHIVEPGAVLYVPPTFHSADGRFDLLVHFHGNAELVEQSVAHTALNALVCVVNVGNGTRRYTDALSPPDALDTLAARSEKMAAELGLRSAHVRRVALSAWSAGFAAVGQILRHEPERVDAVLLMDGLHAPFGDEKTRVPDQRAMQPFFEFSERAAKGQRLLVITHSQIETYTYASTAQTADAILGVNDLSRTKVSGKSLIVSFDAARRATPSRYHDGLVPSSEAHLRGLQVHGYRGDRAEHHIAHLVQMSVTVLPPLVVRWES